LNFGDIGRMNDPPENDVYHQKHVYEHRPILYRYPNIFEKIQSVKEACELSKHTSGSAIDRVKDNIKEGDCPVCCCTLSDDNVIIVKCCGKILCADCGVKGTHITRTQNAIAGKCPNCRAFIAFTDLIFINTDGLNLDDILNCEVTDILNTDPVEEKKHGIPPRPQVNSCKYDVLRRIIAGDEIPDTTQSDVNIPGMLVGLTDLPEAPPNHRKVIVFSRYDESLNELEKKMTEEKVRYIRLGGTAAQIDTAVREFQDSYEGANILLINGERYASGLNLQTATDLVFTHKIIDISIESQIIGRIQRLGRVYKAHIHYILYNNE
jgi:SNF2 family DNA or RNA helicase